MSSNAKQLAEEIVGSIQSLSAAEQIGFITRHIDRNLRMEFAIVPTDVDEGEMDTPIGVVPITLADVEDGFTLLGVPKDLPQEGYKAISDGLAAARKEQKGKTFFMVFDGQIGPDYQVLRLIPKVAYDEDFGERSPATRASG